MYPVPSSILSMCCSETLWTLVHFKISELFAEIQTWKQQHCPPSELHNAEHFRSKHMIKCTPFTHLQKYFIIWTSNITSTCLSSRATSLKWFYLQTKTPNIMANMPRYIRAPNPSILSLDNSLSFPVALFSCWFFCIFCLTIFDPTLQLHVLHG